ncbi:hypothetical protein O3M35_010796 [Rhynocoris fuscipes]|uniref:DNA mismatch repair proteins mutS family domain-containing protein n=1 Tax=Rhynocoris fuscipes TaxID=488301 RepID=A0AAW1D1P1_9HEMI
MSGDNNLFNTIKNYFEEVKLITVRRQCFNNEQGLTALRYLCHPEFSSVDLIIVNKYYCLCAAAAMIVYVELQHNITFAKQSLKVTYESAQGVVTIDLETVRRLELVTSETNSLQPDKYTLLGLMNHTLTLGGRRRLRTEILQPSSTQYKINERLDTVKYLVDNEESLIAIQKALSKFTSVERLLWMCASNKYLKVINTGVSESNSKNSTTLRGFEALINYILLLKQSVEDIPVLSEVLCEIKVEYFQNIREKLDDKRYETIREKIQQVLHDDSKPVRGYQAAELNRCFCVKEGINGLLDVARKTYSSLLDQLQELITGYSEETGLAMSLYLSSDLGFHAKFSLAKDYDLNARPLPSKFTSVKRKGNTYHITTDDLFSYNIRINKIIQEIQLISNAEILQLLDEIRASIGCVHNLCELISEIDAICSIAVASSQKDYVRPIFGSDLNVEAGRHPIMDKFQWNPTPNNVYATIDRNFNIITGPNMGGKTVYILQIALLQIMAQVGCFVPAYSAKFRVTDLIIVRKGLIDNLQCNASSFFIEIKEVMWTMKNTSDTSLIILDEICSGIDVNEGIAIAWAICEEFLQRPAFTFLATHYKFLTNLEKIYPNVKNYQMEALYEGNDTEFGPIVYTHRLIEGVTDVKHYGVRLLLQTSISNSIKQKAINYMKALKLERASALAVAKVMTPEEKKVRAQIEKVESFMKQLYEASLKDDFTTDVVRSFKQIAITEILNDGQDESNIQSTSVRVTELDDMSEESTSRKNKTVEDNAVDDVRITAGPSGTSLPARVLSYHTTSSSSKSAATF